MGNGSLLNYMCFQEGTFFSFNFLTLIDTHWQVQIVARRNFKVDEERHNSWTFNEKNNYIWQKIDLAILKLNTIFFLELSMELSECLNAEFCRQNWYHISLTWNFYHSHACIGILSIYIKMEEILLN